MDPELVALMEDGLRMDAVAFKRIEAVRTEMWRPLAEIFARCDALLTQTNAIPAPAAEGSDADWLALDAEGRLRGFDMTSPFNMLSPCPALSIPSGFARDGLPTAAQIVGRPFDDPTALRIGAAAEAARPFAAWRAEAARDLPRQ
jgi:Asp-tRNA(Asn)/Glu-tRNA(Gln) amidotransferase A subunit family amidase